MSPKASAKAVIVNAVRLVLSGGVYVPPEAVLDTDGSSHDPNECAVRSQSPRSLSALELTARQEQVLALLMRGKSNKEICRVLGIAERTVKIHVTAVLNALRVTSRTQAVIAANELGFNPSADTSD